MPRKTVEENHRVVTGDQVDGFIDDRDYAYELEEAPISKNEEETIAREGISDAGYVTLKLVNGATFTHGGKIYKSGILEPVPDCVAEKLLKTGFFDRA